MRVKRGTTRARERRRLLKRTKGFRWGRKKLVRAAKTAVLKAGVNAYRDRRRKKRVLRREWQVRLNAALRPLGYSYSRFAHALRTNNVALNRKVLVELAEQEPRAFRALVEHVRGKSTPVHKDA